MSLDDEENGPISDRGTIAKFLNGDASRFKTQVAIPKGNVRGWAAVRIADSRNALIIEELREEYEDKDADIAAYIDAVRDENDAEIVADLIHASIAEKFG